MRIFSSSERETLKLGELIGKSLKGSEVICLIGPLGAGKTTLVRGIAEGMGLLQGYQVRSPTFTLINEYPTRKGILMHADLYRVKDLDLEEFVGKGVLVVEWGEGLSICTCTVRIDITEEGRVFEFLGCEELLKALSYDKVY
ncbi:tRNA (adenosine(37)-N6)-threonylcarbamoyltransferase complex ATPase subunit type 1 TsaE [Hydrogenobacter sp. T-2]|uniref:tRNA (adenosine(37)-N6)-threonylcarbamoyltransferase complex ATPase subunit type 1 TsaE n=1 Tax=Pampinifervens diazotrophicum TaxID=1632018 RepID=UPI002B25CC5B|nr:tRNA (adenosine(37)-N6)-threonylcarbamoyltransferase complex ATPase subunit type 1 TsaE [Hydrogenobacter sp. T-2]WPM31441.1 tRNA (adenosine(37)-N6)-threonylcarbamoyltransferase complex ATPase subunit type 1 TsaE [Hydrogenobacter sp. T-2]